MTVFIEFVNTLYTFLNRFIHTAIFNSNHKIVQKIMIMIKRMTLLTFYVKEKTENTVNMISNDNFCKKFGLKLLTVVNLNIR